MSQNVEIQLPWETLKKPALARVPINDCRKIDFLKSGLK